jgi:hypothetical protein
MKCGIKKTKYLLAGLDGGVIIEKSRTLVKE